MWYKKKDFWNTYKERAQIIRKLTSPKTYSKDNAIVTSRPEFFKYKTKQNNIRGINWNKNLKVLKCYAEKYDAPHGNISFKQKWRDIAMK